ncbi:MAG: serine hydrolase domain-containing protein, partial [Acidobacteriota bacterium]
MKISFSFLYTAVLSTILFFSQVQAQPTSGKNLNPHVPRIDIPDNPVGTIVQSFVDAINSPDTLQARNFVHRYLSENLSNTGPFIWSEEKYDTLIMNLRKQSGGITAVDLRQSNVPEFLEVIFQPNAAPRILAVDFMKDPKDDRLRFIEIHAMRPPSGPYQWTKEKLDEAGIAEAINERVKKEVADDQFSGTVLVAKGNRIIFEKAYGYSNREKQEQNTTNTRFHTGSIGKMFTAAAIGQLIEKGLLKVTDTLGNILPNYPNKEAAKSVTVHQLLTHTSGIADPFELGRRKEGEKYTTPGSNFPLFADAPLTMRPGSAHSYSNGNYAVLAAIVEHLSKTTFEDYIIKNIFIPSGMKAAYYTEYTKLPRAVSYSYNPEVDPVGLNARTPVKKLEYQPELEFSGFSLGYLTAEDVYRFLLALRTDKLLSPQ